MNGMRAIHPGEILKGELDELKLSANAFAKALDVSANRVTGGRTAPRVIPMISISMMWYLHLDERKTDRLPDSSGVLSARQRKRGFL